VRAKRAPLGALGVDLRSNRKNDAELPLPPRRAPRCDRVGVVAPGGAHLGKADAELPLLHQPGDGGRDDVVGLDEPRTFTVKPLERAGAEDQDNVAAIGFEPLRGLFGAVARLRPG
jgi:hypothetical protein